MLDKYLDFIKSIVDRWGVKPLLTGGAVYAIYLLADKGIVPGAWAVVGIAAICIALFGFRHLELVRKQKNGGGDA